MTSSDFLRVLAASLLVAGSTACSTSDDSSFKGVEILGQLEGHDVVITPNAQGSDIPCIGVDFADEVATRRRVACPLDMDGPLYAAMVEAGNETFVVGAGLGEEDTVEGPFGQVFLSDEAYGDRFFAATTTQSPQEEFTFQIVAPDGSVRSIVA